jgi:hypothetical protein
LDDNAEYDGFTIVPSDMDGGIKTVFFLLSDESKEGTPIENSELGDKYHVVLFKYNYDTGLLDFNDTFEAIFIDPLYYAKRLLPYFFATFVRKTDKSVTWFDDYILDVYQRVVLKKIEDYKQMLQSISETK